MMMMWYAVLNKVLQLVVNLMIHDTNFNNITFIDGLKACIMPKYVFYDLFYATTMSDMIKKMIKNVFNN